MSFGNGFDVWAGSPGVPVFEGDWIFFGGMGPAGPSTSEARQDVDVSADALAIDAGNVVSFFAGQGRTNEGSGIFDPASFVVEFRSESGTVLDSFNSGTITPFNTWLAIADSRAVPAGTRTIRIRMIATRSIGISTDGFFDDLSLTLAETNGGTYCVGKTNSLGCVPQIAAAGVPGFTQAGAFDLSAVHELNFKNGLLFYGFAAASIPFQGGTLCVQPPLRRTTIQNAGDNTPPANDCSGSYSFDFNAWMQGGQAPNVMPGQPVYAQYWSRDPGSAIPSGLSNAVAFTPSS